MKSVFTALLFGGLWLFPILASADELDDVLNYLVTESYRERTLGPESSDLSKLGIAVENKNFFQSNDKFRIDPVSRSEENGAVEYSTAFYSIKNGPTFFVKVIRPTSVNRISEFRKSPSRQILSLARTFNTAAKLNVPVEIAGYQTVFIERDDNGIRNSLSLLGKDLYLSVRASVPVPQAEFSRFISSLPFKYLDSILSDENTPA